MTRMEAYVEAAAGAMCGCHVCRPDPVSASYSPECDKDTFAPALRAGYQAGYTAAVNEAHRVISLLLSPEETK